MVRELERSSEWEIEWRVWVRDLNKKKKIIKKRSKHSIKFGVNFSLFSKTEDKIEGRERLRKLHRPDF